MIRHHNRIAVYTFLATCFLFGSRPSLAQSAPQDATQPKLTLREIVQTGLKRSPRIKRSAAETEIAAAQTRQARAALFPEIQLRGSSIQTDEETYRAYVDALQPLFVGGALSAGLQFSRQREEIQRQSYQLETRLVLRDLILAYYGAAESVRLLEALEDHVEILKKHAQVISRYEKIGRARRTDKLQTQVNLSLAIAEVARLQTQSYSQREGLRELLALDEQPDIWVSKEVPIAPLPATEPSKLVEIALDNHPTVKIADLTLKQVQNEKSLSLAEDYPSLYLRGQWGYREENGESLFENDFSSVTLELTIPIFSGLSSFAKRREFEQRRTGVLRSLEIAKLAIESELRSELSALTAAKSQLDLALQASQEGRTALKLANRDYERGLISSQDVISIQQTHLNAERLLIQSQYAHARALLQVHERMGVDLFKEYSN